jgi:hypothetical protein
MSDLQDLGMEDVDMTELERALAIVRRKMDDPTDLDFLQKVDDEDMSTLPALKKRLQMVQVSNLSVTRELERAERMLAAQASINRDLHLELEEAHKRARTEKDSLQGKLEDFESLCQKRLQRIHSLEAQIKQHLYSIGGGASSRTRKTPSALDDVVDILDSEDNLLQEVAAGDFGPDENLVEVYIVDAEISENAISSNSSTFMLVDFFDYESQATPLTTGLYPRYGEAERERELFFSREAQSSLRLASAVPTRFARANSSFATHSARGAGTTSRPRTRSPWTTSSCASSPPTSSPWR